MTAPLGQERGEALRMLLAAAWERGFTLPWEGAVHIHFDAAPLRTANAVANIARLFSRHGGMLKRLVRSNPN